MNNYLNVDELDLLNKLRSFDAVEDNTVIIQAASTRGGKGNSIQKAFIDSDAKPILTYFTAIIPSMLNEAFDIGINEATGRKLLGTKPLYENILNPFLKKLEELKFPSTDLWKTKLAFSKYPFEPDTWEELAEYFYKNRSKLKAAFSNDGWLFMRKLFLLMDDFTELDLDAVEWLHRNANSIPDPLLSKYIKSLSIAKQENDAKEKLKAAQKSQKEATLKYFANTNPSADAMKKLMQKSPEQYKEWRKTLTATKKAAKAVIADIWKDKGYSVVDVPIARKIMREHGIEDTIDPGFMGKVGLGTTGSQIFSYYTKYGKLLDCVVGQGVKMNPKYTSEDNTYYCTHLPFASEKNKPIKVYTADHRSKSSQKLHNAAKSSLEVIEDVRNAFSTDLKTILNGKLKMDAEASKTDIKGTRSLCALICRVLDETAGRIGNAGSENQDPPTYGIHNLKVKHLRTSKNSITVKYLGKKGIQQEHRIEDPDSIKAIKLLIDGRDKEDYVFSRDGETCISDSTVRDYLSTTGFPGTPHLFRKLWANLLFNKNSFPALKKLLVNKDSMKPKEFKEAVMEIWTNATNKVAAKLGQTERNTSIRSYISPTLMKDFWDRTGLKMPSVAAKAYEKMATQNPNEEED